MPEHPAGTKSGIAVLTALSRPVAGQSKDTTMQWIGIDVSKGYLDGFARPSGALVRFANDDGLPRQQVGTD